MKNNFITKIIGATLAFAMMIGGAVGINAAKQAKEVNAEDVLYYTLEPASGSNNSYTGNCDVAIGGITWNLTGNSQQIPWRIGGKSLNGVDRTVYSKTAMSSAITKVDLTVGGASSITVNSLKLFVASDASFNTKIDEVAVTFAANDTLTFVPTNPATEWAANAYYKFIFNVSVSGTSNKFVEFTRAKFYRDSNSGGDTPTTYSVTYDANGATGGTAPLDDTEYEANDSVTVLGNTGNLVKENYTFGGWRDEDNDINYTAGGSFEITANTTLYAIWNIEPGFDVLNKAFTEVTGNSYTNWSGKTGASGAVYAGCSLGGNDSIQLKSKDDVSGVVSTTSGGNVRKVTVIWESHTDAGRTLNVYGKNTAYSSAADLYNANTQGTSLGTIVKGTSTSLVIDSDYRYIGVRSDNGAMYLTELHFKWEAVQLNPRVEFSPSSLTLKTNQTNGATVTALVEDVETPTYSWIANDNNVTLENANTATVTIKPNTQVAANSTVTLTVGGTTPNLVETLNITIEIPGPGETAGTAYTVAQAKAAIAAADADIENIYITGIVSKIDEISLSNHNATYWISDDGTTADQFKIYRGKYVDNENFTSNNQIIVGDEVIVYGTISKQYQNLNQGNYIASIDLAPRVTSVVLNPNAITVVLGSDGNIVDLFTNITINQETGSSKTTNDITWTSDDEDVLCVINGNQYLAGDTHRSSTTIHAFIGLVEYANATVTVFRANTHVMDYDLPEEWRVVTDPSTLAAGDQVILTAVDGGNIYAAGTYASGNNVPADEEHALTESNGTVTGVQNTMIYTLVTGNKPGSLAFRDSAGKYLYAASSSSNWMKTQDDIDDNASFILNDDGTVVAQGTYSRKYMRYNPNGNNNGLFACYASNSDTGTLVTFYKLSAGTAELDLFNLNAISEAHEDGNGAYIRLGASLSEEDWATMDSAFGIAGYGVMLIRETTLETTGFDSIEELYNSDSENKSKLSNLGKDSETAPQDFSVAAKINIKNESDRNVAFCAAVYVKSSSGAIYFINETRGSLVGLL